MLNNFQNSLLQQKTLNKAEYLEKTNELKKIDLDKKTYPSPFTLNRLRAIYKKPRCVGGSTRVLLFVYNNHIF